MKLDFVTFQIASDDNNPPVLAPNPPPVVALTPSPASNHTRARGKQRAQPNHEWTRDSTCLP